MTDTPRTDEILDEFYVLGGFSEPTRLAEFARQLERENTALKVELDIWKHRAHRAGFKEDLISTSI